MICFRAATYNIHRSRGMDWRVRPDRIVNVIRELNADVIALQEVAGQHVPELSKQLALPHVFGLDYGNLVFSRLPVLGSANYDISVSGREHRHCLRLDLELAPGRVLHFFAVHLGTSFRERRRQTVHLISEDILANPQLTGARLLAGDINEWVPGLADKLLAHQVKGRSYPGLLGLLALDRIYYDPALKLCGMRVHRTARALMASDHLPLIADFELAA